LTKTKQEHEMLAEASAPAASVLFESAMLCASVAAGDAAAMVRADRMPVLRRLARRRDGNGGVSL
jgi:hypothetical protein